MYTDSKADLTKGSKDDTITINGKGVVRVKRQVIDPVFDKLDTRLDGNAIPLNVLMDKVFRSHP